MAERFQCLLQISHRGICRALLQNGFCHLNLPPNRGSALVPRSSSSNVFHSPRPVDVTQFTCAPVTISRDADRGPSRQVGTLTCAPPRFDAVARRARNDLSISALV